MKLDEIRKLTIDMLAPDDIAEVLGSNAHTISLTARQHPERVRFPFTFTGSRMKIPREAFLRWFDGGN